MSDPLARRGRATETAEGMMFGPGCYAVLEKHRWRTPPEVVESIMRRLGIDAFDLDACAEDDARWADRWITLAEDCLQISDWRTKYRWVGSGGLTMDHTEPNTEIRHVFVNSPWGPSGISKKVREAVSGWDPGYALQPFPGTARFIRKAHEQSRLGMTVAVIVGVSMDTWQRELAMLADEVWFGPRVRYLRHDGELGPHPPGPTMCLVYRPHVPDTGWPGGPRVDLNWTP